MRRSREARGRVGASCLLGLAVLAGGCGGDDVERDSLAQLGLTLEHPSAIKEACAELRGIAARRSEVHPVVCPPVVPAGPAVQVRAWLRPGQAGDGATGVGWAIEATSPAEAAPGAHGGHWRVAANSPAGFRHLGFRPPRRALVARGEVSGQSVRVYEMPPYPAGGVDGDHVVVEWDQVGTTLHVSLHGHGRRERDRAERMAEAMIVAIRRDGAADG